MPTKLKKLLLVDDEPNILKSLERLLGTSYQVTTALGGQAGLDLILNDNIKADIILCDISMPMVNGADFYRCIAEKMPGLEQRIIFMTGGAYTDDLKKFITTVDNDFLSKPFDQNELFKLIEKVGNNIQENKVTK